MPNIVSGSIVYARPPGKRALPPCAPIAAEGDPALPPLTPSAALVTFAKLVGAWAMPPARGWRMLTGVGYRAGSLTADQAARVGYLVAIDAAIRKIGGQPAGVWMVTGNPAAVLGGSAPADYLAKRGLAGYAALWRQVQRWAAL